MSLDSAIQHLLKAKRISAPRATATDVTFESGGTTRLHKVPAGANGGQILPANAWGWFQSASGAPLTVTTGTGSSTEITGVYLEV